MGICGRIMSFYRREEGPVDRRGKVCLANGELFTIEVKEPTESVRVRDVCIQIFKKLGIAPVALDFFTLMTTDCEHCLSVNNQTKEQCDRQKDHYYNPKRNLYPEEISKQIFFLRLAFKAVAGPDLKAVNVATFDYFVKQCRWDYIKGRVNNLCRKDHLTLLVLESIIQAHEENINAKEILENPKRYGLSHLFVDKDYSPREIKSHLKKQLPQFRTAQANAEKAKNSFLYVLEGEPDFGVMKILVKKFYYQTASEDKVFPVEWEILISPNGLKKRRTYQEDRDGSNDESSRVEEMISDYKDIEYIEIKPSQSEEIIHISRKNASLEVISVGNSLMKKESLITLIEGFYHLLVNQYKTLTKYESGHKPRLLNSEQGQRFRIHGPIERKKVDLLLKAVKTENGNLSGVHMIRRSRKDFDSYILSLIHGNEIKHYEIIVDNGKYCLKNGPIFHSMENLLEFYKTEKTSFPTVLTKYCPIPKEGLCALYDDQILVEAPCVPSSSRPLNPDYVFEHIGNLCLQKLSHSFTCGDIGDRVFKARWLKADKNGGCTEVFCRRLETSRSADFRQKVEKTGEKMAQMAHRNLVQFHGIQFYDDQNIYLVFEWLDCGTLDEYLKRETEVTVETVLMFAAQIAEACMYLHDKDCVHGWLAAHNILIVNEEHVKLSDVSVPCLRQYDLLDESVPINRSPWKARECFQGNPYSKESDVWAFGVVLWEMFMKTVPFLNMKDDSILHRFQQGHHLAYPKWCPDEVGKVMKSCWMNDPKERPTFGQIVFKLRDIVNSLSKSQKERKIPEKIDEKFTMEPLSFIEKKRSTLSFNEELPRTSSCNNRDENVNDVWNSNESSMLDDADVDLLPVKDLPEIWSNEEIELKKLERKYPRSVVTLNEVTGEERTYDRIRENDISYHDSVQMNDLLNGKDTFTMELRPTNFIDKDETDVPLMDTDFLARSEENNSEVNPIEEKPLFNEHITESDQSDSLFSSFETMDHMDFLATQLGSENANNPLIVKNHTETLKGTVMDNADVGDQFNVPEEQHDHCVLQKPDCTSFSFGCLDPFAANTELKSGSFKNILRNVENCSEKPSQVSDVTNVLTANLNIRDDKKLKPQNTMYGFEQFSNLDPFAASSNDKMKANRLHNKSSSIKHLDPGVERNFGKTASSVSESLLAFSDRDPMSEFLSTSYRVETCCTNPQRRENSSGNQMTQKNPSCSVLMRSQYSKSADSGKLKSTFPSKSFSGYTPMRTNIPRPILSAAERDSTRGNCASKSLDPNMLNVIEFSKLDPFSEALKPRDDKTKDKNHPSLKSLSVGDERSLLSRDRQTSTLGKLSLGSLALKLSESNPANASRSYQVKNRNSYSTLNKTESLTTSVSKMPESTNFRLTTKGSAYVAVSGRSDINTLNHNGCTKNRLPERLPNNDHFNGKSTLDSMSSLPSFANYDPFAQKPMKHTGVTLFTEAELDNTSKSKDLKTKEPPGLNPSTVLPSTKCFSTTSSSSLFGKTTFNSEIKSRKKSSLEVDFENGKQYRTINKPTVDTKTESYKDTGLNSLQYSQHTSLEDFFSSITPSKRKVTGSDKPVVEMPVPDISNFNGDSEIKLGNVDMDNRQRNVNDTLFENRDPFAEILPQKDEPCSVANLVNNHVHLQTSESSGKTENDGSKHYTESKYNTVLISATERPHNFPGIEPENDIWNGSEQVNSHFLSRPEKQPVEACLHEKQRQDACLPESQPTSSFQMQRQSATQLAEKFTNDDGFNNAAQVSSPLFSSQDDRQGQSPPDKKPNRQRKQSDINSSYAKISIQRVVSPDERVTDGESGSNDERDQLVSENKNEQIVLDPFNDADVEVSFLRTETHKPQPTDTFEDNMRSHQIPFEYLTLGRKLGQGAFGYVTQAKMTRPSHGHKSRTPLDVAVKCCLEDATEIYKNNFKQEAINLMKLENKFIVRFLGVSYNEKKNLLLITELMPQGSLDKYLQNSKNAVILGSEVLLQFAIQIGMGMEYLESKKLVHRDLAARNILVAAENHVKISDFGLSRIYDDEYYRSQRDNQKLPLRWLAPECLEHKKFTVNSDVWSLGVTLWEMFSYGQRPYEDWNYSGPTEFLNHLKDGKRLERPRSCLEEVYRIMKDCWQLKPTSRCSFFLLRTMLENVLTDKYTKRPYFQ
ncbi:uncharacterized protein LOC124443400 [Xenia sp. Carnegie-2017]|uniref:uncharacterized protein LOC124443400 n=1 Tax=Xenia sp. Carnegie-2017 TaxID=2897299 RepID=UPI001F0495AA|nr:uncharacterized protein LOC124443400 [Xenia sp. Carnegie-2017]